MKSILKEFKKHAFVWILLVILSYVAFINYSPNSYLSGWDNLHPEFNFGENIKRSVFSVWQEYQGLGLIGGMGYASDLPRQLILLIGSVVVPNSLLRYSYHFASLFIGVFGVFFLLKNYILKNQSKVIGQIGAFLGALTYLFNLGTLQMFYVPYEPFSTHFAFLPWLFLVNLTYIEKPTKKRLIYLLLVNLLAVPQGYVPTIFYVYALSLGITLIPFLLKRKFKEVVTVLFILFIVNSYWLLPNLYFIVNKSEVNINSKINQMATEDNLLRNQQYGDLQNVALIKGFWFDNVESDEFGNSYYQLGHWKEHVEILYVKLSGYLIFTIALIGIITSIAKKDKRGLLFLPVFVISFVLLANTTPVFREVTELIYRLPLLSQVFRFPFTKFSILLTFSLSIYFTLGCVFILNNIKRHFLLVLGTLLFLSLPIILTFPMLFGNLFYFKTRAHIPTEYFEVINYINSNNLEGRIANFPQYTYWGWSLYEWDYSGSGFIWYGISNPIVDRAFDVWSGESENYYHEISYAIYSKNPELFEDVLNKYNIRYILIDKNLISLDSLRVLHYDELDEIIQNLDSLTPIKSYGPVTLYKFSPRGDSQGFIDVLNNPYLVGPKYNWNNNDQAYQMFGNYINSNTYTESDNRIYYFPFRSLFTGRDQESIEFNVLENESQIIFKTHITPYLTGSTLVIPALNSDEYSKLFLDQTQNIEIYLDGELIETSPESETRIPLRYIKRGEFEVRVPKLTTNSYKYDTNLSDDLLRLKSHNCDLFNNGVVKNTINDRSITLVSQNAHNCFDISVPNLPQRFSYLVSINAQNIEGKSLLFAVKNLNSGRTDLETYLPKTDNATNSTLILPPMDPYALGYSFYIDNISIGHKQTVNNLNRITVNPIPYTLLTHLTITTEGQSSSNSFMATKITSYTHPNQSYYEVNLDKIGANNYLTLLQASDLGWNAYSINCTITLSCSLKKTVPFIFGTKLKNHVLVNNWANGWKLENISVDTNNTKIVLFYTPQLLEYAGFIILVLGIVFIVKLEHNK